MNTTRTFTRIIAGTLLSGGVAVAGVGLAAGTAQAQPTGPHRWCPGDSMVYAPDQRMAQHTGPGSFYSWDMNVCHTWFWLASEHGNVPFKGKLPSNVWDGDNPPFPLAQLPDCPPAILPCL
jgi:hypothetical protein